MDCCGVVYGSRAVLMIGKRISRGAVPGGFGDGAWARTEIYAVCDWMPPMCVPVSALRLQIQSIEEMAQLNFGGFRGIGAVNAVALDALGEEFANGAFGGLGGIGRSHDFAQLRD